MTPRSPGDFKSWRRRLADPCVVRRRDLEAARVTAAWPLAMPRLVADPPSPVHKPANAKLQSRAGRVPVALVVAQQVDLPVALLVAQDGHGRHGTGAVIGDLNRWVSPTSLGHSEFRTGVQVRASRELRLRFAWVSLAEGLDAAFLRCDGQFRRAEAADISPSQRFPEGVAVLRLEGLVPRDDAMQLLSDAP